MNKNPAAPKRCANTARGLDQTANQGAIRPAMKDNGTPTPKRAPGAKRDGSERLTYTVVIAVIALVPLLAFGFSFGNVGLHGVTLGVDPRIAYLTGPAVDLSVVGLIVAASFLSHRGRTERELWPVHAMSVVCAAAMLYLNCGQAVHEHHWRLAVFDAVGPLLLVGWGAIGPWLLRQLARATGASARRSAGAAQQVPQDVPRAQTGRAAPQTPIAPAAPLRDTEAAPRADEESAPAPLDAPAAAAPIPDELVRARQGANARTDAILDLMIRHGRDSVTGAMVAAHFGVHLSNGKRALAKVRDLPELPHLLAARARETETVAEDPQPEQVTA